MKGTNEVTMPRRSARRRALLASLAGAVALVAAACGSTSHSSAPAANSSGGTGSSTSAGSTTAGTIAPPAAVTGTLSGPGVTATTITLGQITTTSGPVPGLFEGANQGLAAWAAYMNAHGGIDGRTIKIVSADDGFNCNTYTNDLKNFAKQVFAMVGTFTLEDTCGKSVLAANPNLIDVQAAALDPTLYSIPNMFTPTPDPPGYQTTPYAYIKSLFPKDITHTASLVGSPAAADGKEEQLTAESIGYKYVYTRLIGPFETNFTSDILRMKNAGVKIVDLGAVAVNDVADFIQQAAQQNFRPDAIISAPAYDAQLLKLVGNASLADNILYAPVPYPLYLGSDRATVPAVNTFLTWLDRTYPGKSANIYSVSAWAAGTLLVDGMRAAGPTIDQASVIKALDGIHTFTAAGLVAPSDPGGRQGTHCVVVAGVRNGHWVRIHPSSGYDCSGVYHSVPLSALK